MHPPPVFLSAGFFIRGRLGVDLGAGALELEHLIGYAADVGLGDFVDLLELKEEAVANRLERLCKSASATGRVPGRRPGRAAEHRVVWVWDISSSGSLTSRCSSLSISLWDSVAHLGRRVAGKGIGQKRKEAGVFVAGEGAETLGNFVAICCCSTRLPRCDRGRLQIRTAYGAGHRIVRIAIAGLAIAPQ